MLLLSVLTALPHKISACAYQAAGCQFADEYTIFEKPISVHQTTFIWYS